MAGKAHKVNGTAEKYSDLPDTLNFAEEIIHPDDLLKLMKRVAHTTNFDTYIQEKISRCHKHRGDGEALDDLHILDDQHSD